MLIDVKMFCIVPGLGDVDAFQRKITLTSLKKKQETLKSKAMKQSFSMLHFIAFH
jgi:hypothetical protein